MVLVLGVPALSPQGLPLVFIMSSFTPPPPKLTDYQVEYLQVAGNAKPGGAFKWIEPPPCPKHREGSSWVRSASNRRGWEKWVCMYCKRFIGYSPEESTQEKKEETTKAPARTSGSIRGSTKSKKNRTTHDEYVTMFKVPFSEMGHYGDTEL